MAEIQDFAVALVIITVVFGAFGLLIADLASTYSFANNSTDEYSLSEETSSLFGNMTNKIENPNVQDRTDNTYLSYSAWDVVYMVRNSVNFMHSVIVKLSDVLHIPPIFINGALWLLGILFTFALIRMITALVK